MTTEPKLAPAAPENAPAAQPVVQPVDSKPDATESEQKPAVDEPKKI